VIQPRFDEWLALIRQEIASKRDEPHSLKLAALVVREQILDGQTMDPLWLQVATQLSGTVTIRVYIKLV
jgi:hypothetical protein